MEHTIHYLAERFKEPSSWAGIGAIAVMFGVHLSASVTQDLMWVGAGVAGLVAFFVPDSQ